MPRNFQIIQNESVSIETTVNPTIMRWRIGSLVHLDPTIIRVHLRFTGKGKSAMLSKEAQHIELHIDGKSLDDLLPDFKAEVLFPKMYLV